MSFQIKSKQNQKQLDPPIDVAYSGSNIIDDEKVAKSKTALQKLAKSFAALNKKKQEKRESTSWQNLVKNALNLQKGKVPLLLAVEAGNQSMCRELLSAQTAEQLKVSCLSISVFTD